MSAKEWAVKAVICVSIFAVASMGVLYALQDKMLYMPDVPIRHILDNPKGYRSPEERRIRFKKVNLKVYGTDDQINGWQMMQPNPLDSEGLKRPTVLFLHENAGNLGLRMDYFSMLYHELGCNIIAFAYRGYSDSSLI